MPPADDRRDRESDGAVLELQNVSFTYAARGGLLEAVANVDLTIDRGEFVCIVGPSGCGKTTLLRLMAGFILPTQGKVLDAGEPVRGPDWRRGMVFQQPYLYPWLTVLGNIEFGPRARGVPAAERARLVQGYLQMVKLEEFADRHTYELSGGMQQRVALARVLANEPHTLLMDEPFGALDALTREHMQDELLAVWRRTGATVVLVTHSVEEAVYLGTRVVACSHRPARIIAEIETCFSRTNGAGSQGRTIKADPEFVRLREQVLGYIWD